MGQILDVLRSPRFVDLSPTQVFHILLDEGTYLASVSSYYRLLRANGEARERRRLASHPPRVRPKLVARKPLVVWSWDITKLKGPKKGEYYDPYVVLDIFSRYVVPGAWRRRSRGSWPKSSSPMPSPAIQVPPGQLTVHADRGSPMTSNPVVEPEHRHSGIGYQTPASVHHGTAAEVRAKRADTLDAAYAANPARFRHRRPEPPKLPTVAWINDPNEDVAQKS